jgi:protein HIRA/HIR1
MWRGVTVSLRLGIQKEMVRGILTYKKCLADVLVGPTEVTFADGKQTLWLDYLPSPVLALTASTTFCAAATQDGSVNVYSHTGRRFVAEKNRGRTLLLILFGRLMATLSFGSPCAMLHGSKLALMILTASGQLSSM